MVLAIGRGKVGLGKGVACDSEIDLVGDGAEMEAGRAGDAKVGLGFRL